MRIGQRYYELQQLIGNMSQLSEGGTLGNLTPEQEAKLRKAWIHLLRLSGHAIPEAASADTPDQSPRFLQHLTDSGKSPEGFKRALWRFIVNDHPDATVLRFLRARKWDVELAVEMLVSAVNWRREMNLDETIVRHGESVGLASAPSRTDREFLDQYRSGKSYARNTDRENRPIYIARVRMHDPGKQGSEAMERYILHSIESLRLLARAPHDKACLIFDMAGFGLKNMDYHVAKFLVHVFEARYPETLGAVLVHNAPFVFWGIWNVVKHWLDPNVAIKINFTKTKSDLLKFVHEENLQSLYGGKDDWQYKYIEPQHGENEAHNSPEHEEKLSEEREELVRQFEQLTLDWTATTHQSKECNEKETERQAAAHKLQENYWRLDPYIRAKTYYHRAGTLDGNTGRVDFKATR